MLRFLGSLLCVVVMAAFVFGCGGGGGGGTATPGEPPPMVEPTPDPEPTDAERITELQQEVTTILNSARARAAGASSAASTLESNTDATAAQMENAASHSQDAQDALALIVSANSDAQAATTPAAALAALERARTAQNTLNTAASAITFIRDAVQAVTNARMQREADQIALTGGSSLIQHLRDNKLLSDAVLGAAGANLTATSLVVGAAGAEGGLTDGVRADCTAPCAEHPLYTGSGAGADRVTGQRTVRITPTGGTALTSSSTTPTLTGTSTLSHGFDLNNAPTPGTDFVNAYTDVDRERRGARNETDDDVLTTPYDGAV